MSRFVSPLQERGNVNYEDLVKFLAKCIGEATKRFNSPPPPQRNPPTGKITSPREDQGEKYDPDEQAILRLMHENMREWDQVNLIDCDNLRRKFYEIDPYNRYILTQREVCKFKESILKLNVKLILRYFYLYRSKMLYIKIEFRFKDP